MAIYQQVNLYQPIFRKQRQVFSARTLALCAAVVGVALLGIYEYGLVNVARLEADVAQLEGREKALTAQLAQIDPNIGANRRAEVTREIASLNATLLDQQRLIAALREQPPGATEGFSGYLAALGRQHTPLLWLTNLTINGATRAIELGGRSLEPKLVPEYLQRLGAETELKGQRFDRLEIEREKDSAEISFHVTSRKVDPHAEEALAAHRP